MLFRPSEAIKMPCPTCKAKPGERCVSKNGVFSVQRFHVARQRLYTKSVLVKPPLPE